MNRLYRLWPWALVLALAVPAARAETLEQLQTLAAGGAAELALQLLRQEQPALADDSAGWMAWERTRVELLAAHGQWQRLFDHLSSELPAALPPEFSRWCETWRARAMVELGQGAEARALLRRLLWSGDGDDAEVAQWRRLVIRSYRADDLGDDAYAAMLRYRHDYGSGGRDDALLSGQVLLGQGRAADAVEALAGVDDLEGQSLLLLARLRSGQVEPHKAQREVRALLKRKDLTPSLQQQCESILAESSAAAADSAAQAIALEQLFGRIRRYPLDREVFSQSPDALWDAYLTYARTVGNREQLLIGDDAAWFAAAKAAGKMYPIRVRSIYALLALNSPSEQTRQTAHAALVNELMQQDDGAELLWQLYLAAPRFADIATVPVVVRRALLDPVIAAGDLTLASRLLAGLDEPPPGTDRVMWRLRRAKVFVLAADFPHASEVLGSLVEDGASLSKTELDRLVQVLFDLQTVGEHDTAYRLFDTLQQHISDQQRRRELWYWMADSRMAQSRPLEAAALYLRSATVAGPDAMDPWAQTARYQAAQALAKAGLTDDARTLYQQLYAATDDAGRHAVLQRDMQQLLLVQHDH